MSIEKITGAVMNTASQSMQKTQKIRELAGVLTAVKDKKADDIFQKMTPLEMMDLLCSNAAVEILHKKGTDHLAEYVQCMYQSKNPFDKLKARMIRDNAHFGNNKDIMSERLMLNIEYMYDTGELTAKDLIKASASGVYKKAVESIKKVISGVFKK